MFYFHSFPSGWPVFPALLVKEIVFSPLYILASFVKDKVSIHAWIYPWAGKIFSRREWLPTPVFWPGKSHGQRSLVGYSPWGHKESDKTKLFHFTSLHFMDTLSLTKEARIYSEEKIISSTSGAGKTDQPLVKEWN